MAANPFVHFSETKAELTSLSMDPVSSSNTSRKSASRLCLAIGCQLAYQRWSFSRQHLVCSPEVPHSPKVVTLKKIAAGLV